MRRLIRTGVAFAAVAALGFLAPRARAEDAPKKENTAVKPAAKQGWWMGRHKAFLDIVKKGGVDVLFLGDSITDDWGGEGHSPRARGGKVFEKEFVPLKAANFGIGGDRTENVLWRLLNGELDGIKPKVVMLMIGTNNIGANSDAEIAAGIRAVVAEIRKRSPKTKVLLLGIFPRGEKPDTGVRKKIQAINEMVSKLDDGGKTVKYLDIGAKFLKEDGTLTKEIMYDFLHLTPEGYRIWADAVKGPIKQLLK